MANRQRNFLNRENNNLRQNLIQEEEIQASRLRQEEEQNLIRQEETQASSRGRSAFRQDQRSSRSRPPSRIPIPIRRNRVIDGVARSIRNNVNTSFTEPDVPHQLPGETHENTGIAGDYISELERRKINEQNNPITAQFYRKGDLTETQFEQLGFIRLKPGMEIVDNINEATYVEHILPDGTSEFHPAGSFEADPRNPDNLLTAQKISDESEIDDEENQRRRSMLQNGCKYRLLYVAGENRNRPGNDKYGGDFKYHLKEEVPFSLSDFGIYKKSEEELLEVEEINTNCFVEAFKEHPKEYDILKNNYLNTYTKCDADT